MSESVIIIITCGEVKEWVRNANATAHSHYDYQVHPEIKTNFVPETFRSDFVPCLRKRNVSSITLQVEGKRISDNIPVGGANRSVSICHFDASANVQLRVKELHQLAVGAVCRVEVDFTFG